MTLSRARACSLAGCWVTFLAEEDDYGSDERREQIFVIGDE